MSVRQIGKLLAVQMSFHLLQAANADGHDMAPCLCSKFVLGGLRLRKM